MHDTAYRIGALVMDTYLPLTPTKILEIGAQNINGSLRDRAPRNAEYTGLDFDEGEGVDIVVTGLADWQVADGYFDLVMASSVFEHDKTFWQTFLAMCSKTKPSGHIYVSAPSNGTVHRYPQDYWRFYPDAGLALEEYACDMGIEVSLVESFVAEREADVWNDFCAVFRRGPSDAELNRDFVYQKTPSTNVLTWRSSAIINPMADSQDTRLLRAASEETQRWVRHSDHLKILHAEELEVRSRHASEMAQAIEQQALRLATLDEAVGAKDEELEIRSQHISDMAQAIEQQTLRLADLNKLVADKDDELEIRSQHISDMSQIIGQKTLRLADLNKTLAGKDDELKTKSQHISDMAQAVEQKTLHVATLDKVVVAKDEELDTLRKRVKSLTGEFDRVIAETQTQARNSDRLIAKAEQAHEAAKAELEESRKRYKVVFKDLSETRWRLDECRDEIASLSDMIAEVQDQIADLERQNEWLRKAGAFLLERGKWWWRFMPLAWQRSKRNARLSRRGLFDCETYMRRYPDVNSSGQDPLRHFIHHGVAENRRYD